MKNKFFALLSFLVKLLLWAHRKAHVYFWETLQDLPENKRYVVIGLMPANLFSSNRPIWIADADQFVGPMAFHSSRTVETRCVMLQSSQIEDRIGLGDEVYRKGIVIKVTQRGKIDYSSAMMCRPVPEAA